MNTQQLTSIEFLSKLAAFIVLVSIELGFLAVAVYDYFNSIPVPQPVTDMLWGYVIASAGTLGIHLTLGGKTNGRES